MGPVKPRSAHVTIPVGEDGRAHASAAPGDLVSIRLPGGGRRVFVEMSDAPDLELATSELAAFAGEDLVAFWVPPMQEERALQALRDKRLTQARSATLAGRATIPAEFLERWAAAVEGDLILSLESFTGPGAELERLAPLAGRLKALVLEGSKTIDDSSLAPLRAFSRLRELSLARTAVVRPSVPGSLTSLDVNGSPVGDEWLAGLTRQTPDLEILGLSGTAVTALGASHLGRFRALRALFASGLPLAGAFESDAPNRLELLLANGATFTDEDVIALHLAPHLVELQLSATQITDRSIDELLHADALWRLDVGFTNVTPRSLARLAALPSLRHVAARGVLTAEVREAIHKARPDIVFV